MNPRVLKTEGFKHLDRVVDLCAKHGIYTILDLHTLPGGQVSVLRAFRGKMIEVVCRMLTGIPTRVGTSPTSGSIKTSKTVRFGYGRSLRIIIREIHGES
jgi:hypothetical protein